MASVVKNRRERQPPAGVRLASSLLVNLGFKPLGRFCPCRAGSSHLKCTSCFSARWFHIPPTWKAGPTTTSRMGTEGAGGGNIAFQRKMCIAVMTVEGTLRWLWRQIIGSQMAIGLSIKAQVGGFRSRGAGFIAILQPARASAHLVASVVPVCSIVKQNKHKQKQKTTRTQICS